MVVYMPLWQMPMAPTLSFLWASASMDHFGNKTASCRPLAIVLRQSLPHTKELVPHIISCHFMELTTLINRAKL
ncbi:hypothetical protein ACFLVX_03445, partial [Chloroflexota bacterium]